MTDGPQVPRQVQRQGLGLGASCMTLTCLGPGSQYPHPSKDGPDLKGPILGRLSREGHCKTADRPGGLARREPWGYVAYLCWAHFLSCELMGAQQPGTSCFQFHCLLVVRCCHHHLGLVECSLGFSNWVPRNLLGGLEVGRSGEERVGALGLLSLLNQACMLAFSEEHTDTEGLLRVPPGRQGLSPKTLQRPQGSCGLALAEAGTGEVSE